jgi:hypothetical protein
MRCLRPWRGAGASTPSSPSSSAGRPAPHDTALVEPHHGERERRTAMGKVWTPSNPPKGIKPPKQKHK